MTIKKTARAPRGRSFRPLSALFLLCGLSGLWGLGAGCDPKATSRAMVATIEVVRTPVELRGGPFSSHPIGGDERGLSGQTVVVPEAAQALIRHDLGARLVVDGGSELTLHEDGVTVVRGRSWVDARPGAPLLVHVGDNVLTAGGAGFEVSVGQTSLVTVVRGEVAWQSPSQRGVVHAGERISLSVDKPKAQPVVLWEDWTGGLGWPDPRRSKGASGLGEVGARRPGDLGEARFPLSIQRLQVRTRIEDDLAITTVEQTFFNPADDTLEGIFRVRLPEGALLSRFAIDRHGRYIDGYVKERETAQKQYQAQVYAGSTKDPALLEWESPGQYKARLYPLPPGSTRRVLFTYTEWLQSHGEGGALRTFRYPMGGAAGDGAPLIQELDIEVETAKSGATELRAGLGALLSQDKRRVVLQRTDYLPSADLVVELAGPPRPEDVARLYRAPHQIPPQPGSRPARSEGEYVLIRTLPVPAPASAQRAAVDLVLLVDVSAGTDATHLAMARTLIESVLRRLTPEDRVVLLGADLDAHALQAGPGKAAGPKLVAATPETQQALLAQLGATRTGGATDLGAALSQAAALLEPGRLGSVLYVGDAQPTVGELDLPTLRERLGSMAAPLRLYGVGIGAEANLDLLSGLCQQSAGQAYRVSDRAAAAETALGIITHMVRPVASRLKVDVGTGLDSIYPRQAVSVRAGEPLFVLARLRQSLPQSVTVEGIYAGQPFRKSFRVESHSIDDTADLRLRWSQARLLQLLDSGASTEEVAELGVRQNLITPFTSFYVPSEDEVSLLERTLPPVRAAGCARSEAPVSAASVESAPVSVAASTPAEQAAPDPGRREVEGKMGKKMAKPMAKKYDSAADSDDAPAKEEARAAAPAAEPETAASAAPPPPPKPAPSRGPKGSSGKDFEDAKSRERSMDALVGNDKSDGYGAAGFGLVGTGRGGGGTGEGTIGLGNLGTIGHGKSGSLRPSQVVEKKRKLKADRRRGGDDEAELIPVSKPILDLDGDQRITVVVGILTHRPKGCSAASQQPLDERRELWRERLGMRTSVRRALEVFQDAERGCELPRWTDRRELLKLMLRNCGGPSGMVALYKRLDDQPEEQDFLRQAILGEVKNPRDLRIIFDGLGLGDEERATLAQEVVRKAKTPEERLRRISDLLLKWPGDMRLRLMRLEAEEELGQLEAARRTAEEVRRDPYADAQARTAVGELYVRLGDEGAARRAFSEIVEFAPREPLARRRLGDLYRAHGWYDEAYRQYQTLLTLQPGDQSVLLLMAMAAAGASHLEEALGLEQRVIGTSEPGSETGLSKVALLSTSLRLMMLREAARQKSDAEELARLVLRTRQSGAQALARPVRVLLTWAHPEADLELKVSSPGDDNSPANDLAPQFGLLGWHSAKDQSPTGNYEIWVNRVDRAQLVRYPAQLTVVVSEGEAGEKVVQLPLLFAGDQTSQHFVLRGGRLEAQPEAGSRSVR